MHVNLIWHAYYAMKLSSLTKVLTPNIPFFQVTTDLSAPVSAISLAVPAGSQYEVNLAIGRVSGSLETWTWNTCSSKIENTNACHAHDQVVKLHIS